MFELALTVVSNEDEIMIESSWLKIIREMAIGACTFTTTIGVNSGNLSARGIQQQDASVATSSMQQQVILSTKADSHYEWH